MKHVFLILTDSCNAKCSFCYKKKQSFSKVSRKMTPTMAVDVINWLIDKELWDPSDPKAIINLWGGEPLLNYELIEFLLTEYPQIGFRMNTNGALADREKVKFLADHFYHLTLTLSLGSAYETYGGVEKAILLLRPIAEQIASINGRWGVNFVVTHPERLYEDCKIMKDYGIENILIDIPRFVEISDSYADLFIESYRKVVQEFKLKDGRGLEQGMKYCGSGIDKILVDPSGDVYPCDGFYGLRFKKLGNIYHEFDMGNFEFFKNLKNEVACFYANCKDCPTQCWFERCMTANIIKNKDMFSPDSNWCKIRKIFKELRKEEAVYV